MGSRIELSQGRTRAGLAALCAALFLTALGAAGTTAASASTASKAGNTINYVAAAGETNQAVISLSGATYTLDDPGATVTAGAGCTRVDANTATCPSSGVTAISADVGNLNDVLWVTAATASTLTGGDGNDTVIGNNAADVLIGCVGNDSLIGGGGADQLFDGFFNCSGGGNDSLDGGAGADGMFGGSGTDTATYAGRTVAVNVVIDGVANDGEAGEGDSVSTDIENVTGGSGADNITGSPANNTLRGENGDDVLVGERPTDQDPEQGDDSILGGNGNDALAGGGGDNQIVGGAGNDVLHGGLGADGFDAGSGEDEIRAQDGIVDAVNCGTDFDFGFADPDDVISPNCESLELESFPGEGEFPFEEFPTECLPGDLPVDGPTIFQQGDLEGCVLSELEPCAALRIVRKPASLRKGEVGVRVKLPEKASGVCRAKLRLETQVEKPGRTQPRRLKIGAEPFSLRPGNAKRFEVEISRAGRRLLRREDHISARVAVFTRGEDASKVASATIRIQSRGR